MSGRRGRYEAEESGRKAWKCKYCGKAFADVQKFKVHKRKEHWEEMSYRSEQSSVVSGAQPRVAPHVQPSRGRGRPRRAAAPPVPLMAPSSPSISQEQRGESAAGTDEDGEEQQKQARTPPRPKSPPKSPRGRPAKNMPLPIGKKRKVKDPVTGVEREEWLRNPTFSGA